MTTTELAESFYSILDTLSELKSEFDFLLSNFLQFTMHVRGEKEKYTKQQFINILKFYMNVYNTLSLESDYLYAGNISIKFQLAEEANKKNHVYEEKSLSKTKC